MRSPCRKLSTAALLLVVTFFFSAIACILPALSQGAVLRILSQAEYPTFQDDLELQGLAESIEESLIYLKKLPAEKDFFFAGKKISVHKLIRSLSFFQKLIRKSPSAASLNKSIQTHFNVYALEEAVPPKNSKKTPLLFLTGYYQPIFAGSMERKPPYVYPLYKVPPSLIQRQISHNTVIGRLHQGQIVPFWTRKEIEEQELLKGFELIWLKDPFDRYVIHIQGSALIHCTSDNTIRGVRFAAKNGREYTSIGRYLVDSGKMRLKDVTMDSIRIYLQNHPDEQDDVLQQNESYIFFKWNGREEARGNIDRPLTPGRSVAADQQYFPPGTLMYLNSSIPKISHGKLTARDTLTRFVSVQDTGSGIKGPSHLDLFCGSGMDAGTVAGAMKERGALYVLFLKSEK